MAELGHGLGMDRCSVLGVYPSNEASYSIVETAISGALRSESLFEAG